MNSIMNRIRRRTVLSVYRLSLYDVIRICLTFSTYKTAVSGSLYFGSDNNLLITQGNSALYRQRDGQSAVILCGWGVKAGMVRSLADKRVVAGKTV